MATLGADAGVEVSLFLGPRGAWDTGGQSFVTSAAGGVARGDAGVDTSSAEVRRGVELGIRSFLVADLGVLATLGRHAAGAGSSPRILVLKTSVLLPCANPATARDARGARRDDDQRLDRPVAGRARRAARRLLRAARRLRRGAGRPGRLRALLRRARDRPARRARVREARAAKRAEHLPVRDCISRIWP